MEHVRNERRRGIYRDKKSREFSGPKFYADIKEAAPHYSPRELYDWGLITREELREQ